MYDFIVIGGGIVGSSIAYHLVCQGAKTLLIDRQDPGRATDAGAGTLSPETNTRDPESWFNFAIEAVGYYPTLLAQLENEQAGDTGYVQCGTLIVAVSEDDLTYFEQKKQHIFQRQERRGLPSSDDLHIIAPEAAQVMFPALAPVHEAIYFRQAARVDGKLLTQAMRRAAQARGLSVEQTNVEQLILEGQSVKSVIADGKALKAGGVVIAGGAWAGVFGEQLGVQIPVEPQRGQIIHLHLRDTDTSNWPIISAARGYYMLAWPGGRIVVGGTRETGSGFKPYTSVAGVHEVLTEALRVAPGLAQAEIKEIRVGLRPLTSDTMPVLGRVPGVDNIYLATGHGPTGLQLGPYSGKLIADMMLGQDIATDISAFDIARFL